MSEDALVNTGAVTWPDPDSAYFAVRRMQTKLHRWAGEDPSRRFGDLFNLVYDPAFLVHAWERVSTNKGARTAGIDGATAAQVEAVTGVEAYLNQIRDSLKSGQFQPVEVRQVMIPKGKTGKFRKLGIPTVIDRVVQASLKLVLSKRISDRVRMGSAPNGVRGTRSLRSTTPPRDETVTCGFSRPTSEPVLTRSRIRR